MALGEDSEMVNPTQARERIQDCFQRGQQTYLSRRGMIPHQGLHVGCQ